MAAFQTGHLTSLISVVREVT